MIRLPWRRSWSQKSSARTPGFQCFCFFPFSTYDFWQERFGIPQSLEGTTSDERRPRGPWLDGEERSDSEFQLGRRVPASPLCFDVSVLLCLQLASEKGRLGTKVGDPLTTLKKSKTPVLHTVQQEIISLCVCNVQHLDAVKRIARNRMPHIVHDQNEGPPCSTSEISPGQRSAGAR